MTPVDFSLVALGGLVFALVIYLALSLSAQRSRTALATVSKHNQAESGEPAEELSVRVLGALPALDFLVVPSQRESMRRKLRRLGYASRLSLRAFAAFKVLLAIILGLLGVWVGSSVPAAATLLGVALLALGLYLPDVVVDRRLQEAEQDIQYTLPGTIDLLNICIRAGMNLEKAISRVTEETSGPLAIDLRVINERAGLGDSVEDAVRQLSANQEISHTTSGFLSTISRATRLGVPLASVIEQSAQDMRKQQIDVIKTSAAKLPVKILLPLMLFLLPAVLLIVLGPAVLSLIDGFQAL